MCVIGTSVGRALCLDCSVIVGSIKSHPGKFLTCFPAQLEHSSNPTQGAQGVVLFSLVMRASFLFSLPITVLQMEARSAVHLHGLNKGLEMKIIELQLRLDEGERQRMAAQDLWNNEKINYEQVHTLLWQNPSLRTPLKQGIKFPTMYM